MKKYLFTVLLLAFCACANNQTSNAKYEKPLPNQCPNVLYADASLEKTLSCEEVPVFENTGLQANVTLANIKGGDVSLKVSVDWFHNGVHIKTQELAKKEITIFKNDVKYLTFTAPSTMANGYKIRIFKITNTSKKGK